MVAPCAEYQQTPQGDHVHEHQEAPDQVRIRIIFVIAYDEAERKKTKLIITETKMSVMEDPRKSVTDTAKKVMQKLSVNLSKQA